MKNTKIINYVAARRYMTNTKEKRKKINRSKADQIIIIIKKQKTVKMGMNVLHHNRTQQQFSRETRRRVDVGCKLYKSWWKILTNSKTSHLIADILNFLLDVNFTDQSRHRPGFQLEIPVKFKTGVISSMSDLIISYLAQRLTIEHISSQKSKKFLNGGVWYSFRTGILQKTNLV